MSLHPTTHITPNCHDKVNQCVQRVNQLAATEPTLMYKKEIETFRNCMPSHCDAFTEGIVKLHRTRVAEFELVRDRQDVVMRVWAQAEHAKPGTPDHDKAHEAHKKAQDDLELAVKAVKGDWKEAGGRCPGSTTTQSPLLAPYQQLQVGPANTQHMIRTHEECTRAGHMLGHLEAHEKASIDGGHDGPPGCFLKHSDNKYHVFFNEVGATKCDSDNKGKYDCSGTKQCDSNGLFKLRKVECTKDNACIQHRYYIH